MRCSAAMPFRGFRCSFFKSGGLAVGSLDSALTCHRHPLGSGASPENLRYSSGATSTCPKPTLLDFPRPRRWAKARSLDSNSRPEGSRSSYDT